MSEEKKKVQLRTTVKQRAMIKALEETLGNVTRALKIANVARTTHYRWLEESTVYSKKVDDIKEIALDHVEDKLHTLIDEGVPSATIFYMKTMGKGRGYFEKIEQSYDPQLKITIEDGSGDKISN